MPSYNQKPRPRVLFEELPPQLVEELALLVPASQSVFVDTEVEETEFDLVVTFAPHAARRRGHLHVLSFGASRLDSVAPADPMFSTYYPTERTKRTLATEASIPASIDSELQALLERTAVSNLPSRQKLTWKYASHARVNPLIELGTQKLPYALLWTRTQFEDSGLSVVLPEETTDHRAWLVWFLRRLHEVDPVTFAGDVEWATTRTWATSTTIAFHDKLDDALHERERVVAQLEETERALVSALESAQKSDEVGYQRLLSADGAELVEAVQNALMELGFIVTDMDDHHDAVTQAKLEDLRITDPADANWIALAEVKGYTKGAKTNDVGQILGRPMRAYIKETGNEPSVVWHIVNHERTLDPSARNDAIPNDVDLEALREADGSLIETRQIFLALRDVQQGAKEAAAVRNSLKDTRMRWDYRRVE